MLKMSFRFMKETKGCYRFETEQGPEWTALYLKKRAVEDAGIDPYRGVTVMVVGDTADGKGSGRGRES